MGTETIEEQDAQGGTETIEQQDAATKPSGPPSASFGGGMPMLTPRIAKKEYPFKPQAPVHRMSGQERDAMGVNLVNAALMGMAGGAGGTIGRQLIPKLWRPAAAAIGETGATTLMGILSGMKPSTAATAGALAGGSGLAVEGGLNLGSRLVGSVTSTPGSVISDTLKLPTTQQAGVMFGVPKGMPERAIGMDLLDRAAAARSEISPGRLTKTSIMTAAEKSGVRVPLKPLDSTIQSGIADADMAVGQANRQASAKLGMLQRDLQDRFPTGDLTPTQADAQLRAFQRDADAAAARNNPFLAQTYRNLKKSLRDSFFKSVDTALPGSNIAKATSEAKKYLDSVDTLSSFMNDKTPETFVRSLFGGDQQAQSAMAALREFEVQTGTGGKIEQEIGRLALKRAWTSEETGRAFSLWRAMEKVIAKPAVRTMILGSRPAGQATTAFTAAMQGSNQENR